MKLLKQALAVLGAVVVIAAIAALVTPKTAHALVATMVEVVNTAEKPATTEDISKAASQIVELFCTNSETTPCTVVKSNEGPGAGGPTFTVPAGQNFVITSVDIFADFSSPSGLGEAQIDLCSTAGCFEREGWIITQPGEAHFQYPSGIVIAPGSTLSAFFVNASPFSAFILRGYLTSM
jgi:hypothetical protein